MNHKMQSLQDIMKWADSKAYGKLKKKGAPDAVMLEVDAQAPAAVAAPEGPKESGEPEMTPELIAALEELLNKAKIDGADSPAGGLSDLVK